MDDVRNIFRATGMVPTSILNLDHVRARAFFLREENYAAFDLPEYFKFSELLAYVSNKLGNSDFCFYQKDKPDSFDVNYKILFNKDGEYAWRPLQLLHPVLYVQTVHDITREKNWEIIKGRFVEFQGDIIECMSIPVEKIKAQKSQKSTQILNWWDKVEQKSIELAMEYDYCIHLDIVNCYGSIYTHSIAWALHGKGEAKNHRYCPELLGNLIDKRLRSMSNGQTNGIPQGSVLMDFIAEMVLGYVDLELTKKLCSLSLSDKYKIIRYRDDYRIFINSSETGKTIAKELTNVLSEMGMGINAKKTAHFDDLIQGAVKPAKLFWMIHRYEIDIMRKPIQKLIGHEFNMQKILMIIYDMSQKHPNSGVLLRVLLLFYDQMAKKSSKNTNIKALISILVNIAFKNPRTYPIVSAIISRLLTSLNDEVKKDVIKKIVKRFQKLPNTEHLDLWLQRITLKIEGDFGLEGKLCQKVNDSSIEIWDSEWLDDTFRAELNSQQIIDHCFINKMDTEISRDEVETFKKPYGS